MAIYTLANWKTATANFASRRNGAIGAVDECLQSYHSAAQNDRPRKLRELRASIENMKEEKRHKHAGDYTQSKRYDATNEINFDTLFTEVEDELDRLPVNTAPLTAMHVCGKLFDIKMADVDFSVNVRAAAKAKMFGSKSNYDIVKQHWEAGEGGTEVAVSGGIKQTPYQQHEASLTQAKLKTALPFGPNTISIASINSIARIVKQYRYAVCESITATVISDCHAANIGCQMEWIGIPYTSTTGHSIAVFDRIGEVDKPNTWGDQFFIVDMWYFNFGMRPTYLYTGVARDQFVLNEITPYNTPKVMACIP